MPGSPAVTLSSVLVIDDSDGDALLAEMAVATGRPGVQVLHADSGERAHRLLAESDVDVILLDLAMPGLSGFDLLDQLQAADLVRAPVVVLTSSTQPNDRREAERRALPYVVKDSDYRTFTADLTRTLAAL